MENNKNGSSVNIKDLLQLVVSQNASDLHLIVGNPPMLRIDGQLTPVPNESVLTQEVVSELVKQSLTAEQQEMLAANKELDLSLSFSEKARFRVNVYTQKQSLAVAYRQIPLTIPTVEELNLPKILHSLTHSKQGLILVTGPTGHGKSTTIAAMINEINNNRSEHIITIEDPIEFIFKPIQSIFSQREMHKDTHSWKVALRSVLREDPDVVYIGEMRDYETIAAALTVAETGHLVFATLHTNSAAQTIDRIVDVFPENQQSQVKMQLSNVIEAVFSQRLIPAINGGRLPAYEVLLGTAAVRNAIREGKTHQIDSIIQTSSEFGMNTLDASLAEMVREGKITLQTAHAFSIRPDELNRLVRG